MGGTVILAQGCTYNPAALPRLRDAGGIKSAECLTNRVSGFGNVSGCLSCLETLGFLVGTELVARYDHIETLQCTPGALVVARGGAVKITAGVATP